MPAAIKSCQSRSGGAHCDQGLARREEEEKQTLLIDSDRSNNRGEKCIPHALELSNKTIRANLNASQEDVFASSIGPSHLFSTKQEMNLLPNLTYIDCEKFLSSAEVLKGSPA